MTAAFCFVFKDLPFGAWHSAWILWGGIQHHAKDTSPSCKRKIHFLLSIYILSAAVFKELTSENDPHSHQLKPAFDFTSLKPPRQQLFLPGTSVCWADREMMESPSQQEHSHRIQFKMLPTPAHTKPPTYRPVARRANTPRHTDARGEMHADRQTRWEMHILKVRTAQGGRCRHVG